MATLNERFSSSRYEIVPDRFGRNVSRVEYYPQRDKETGKEIWKRLQFPLYKVVLREKTTGEKTTVKLSLYNGVESPKITIHYPPVLRHPWLKVGDGKGRKIPDVLAPKELFYDRVDTFDEPLEAEKLLGVWIGKEFASEIFDLFVRYILVA